MQCQSACLATIANVRWMSRQLLGAIRQIITASTCRYVRALHRSSGPPPPPPARSPPPSPSRPPFTATRRLVTRRDPKHLHTLVTAATLTWSVGVVRRSDIALSRVDGRTVCWLRERASERASETPPRGQPESSTAERHRLGRQQCFSSPQCQTHTSKPTTT